MIRIENLTKVFETANGPVVAAENISMEVPKGEICILLGPSGCGKTTALKMVNRLIPPTSGKIYIDGEDTSKLDDVDLRRNIGYVIQQIGLFPNMTIEQNICVVPRLLGWDAEKAKTRASDLLDMVGLDPKVFLQRYPKELSGGQQQRIGVIRALASDPPVMLMDEPFGAIDPINREIIQDEFLKMQAELKKTIMFVSHDIDEAVKMGDKVAIFRAGKLVQYDDPDSILAHPKNDFVADFVGSDRTLKRLRLLTARQVCDADAPAVSRHARIEDAVAIIREKRGDFAIVMESDHHASGFVTLDMLRGASGSVSSLEMPLKTAVPHRADLRTVVSEMFEHDTRWVCCVDDEGHYAGVVTHEAVIHVLGEEGAARTQ